jgi:hypothetical protein
MPRCIAKITLATAAFSIVLVGVLPTRAQEFPTFSLKTDANGWGEPKESNTKIDRPETFTPRSPLPSGQCRELPDFSDMPKPKTMGDYAKEFASNSIDALSTSSTSLEGVHNGIFGPRATTAFKGVATKMAGYGPLLRDAANVDVVGGISTGAGIWAGGKMAMAGAAIGSRAFIGNRRSIVGGILGGTVGAFGGAVVSNELSKALKTGLNKGVDLAPPLRRGLDAGENSVRDFRDEKIDQLLNMNEDPLERIDRKSSDVKIHSNPEIQAALDYFEIEENPRIKAYRPDSSAVNYWLWERERLSWVLTELENGCNRRIDLEVEIYDGIQRAEQEACFNTQRNNVIDEVNAEFGNYYKHYCRQ